MKKTFLKALLCLMTIGSTVAIALPNLGADQGSLNCFSVTENGVMTQYVGVNQRTTRIVVDDVPNDKLLSDEDVHFVDQGNGNYKAITKGNVEGPGAIYLTITEALMKNEKFMAKKGLVATILHSEPGVFSEKTTAVCSLQQ